MFLGGGARNHRLPRREGGQDGIAGDAALPVPAPADQSAVSVILAARQRILAGDRFPDLGGRPGEGVGSGLRRLFQRRSGRGRCFFQRLGEDFCGFFVLVDDRLPGRFQFFLGQLFHLPDHVDPVALVLRFFLRGHPFPKLLVGVQQLVVVLLYVFGGGGVAQRLLQFVGALQQVVAQLLPFQAVLLDVFDQVCGGLGHVFDHRLNRQHHLQLGLVQLLTGGRQLLGGGRGAVKILRQIAHRLAHVGQGLLHTAPGLFQQIGGVLRQIGLHVLLDRDQRRQALEDVLRVAGHGLHDGVDFFADLALLGRQGQPVLDELGGDLLDAAHIALVPIDHPGQKALGGLSIGAHLGSGQIDIRDHLQQRLIQGQQRIAEFGRVLGIGVAVVIAEVNPRRADHRRTLAGVVGTVLGHARRKAAGHRHAGRMRGAAKRLDQQRHHRNRGGDVGRGSGNRADGRADPAGDSDPADGQRAIHPQKPSQRAAPAEQPAEQTAAGVEQAAKIEAATPAAAQRPAQGVADRGAEAAAARQLGDNLDQNPLGGFGGQLRQQLEEDRLDAGGEVRKGVFVAFQHVDPQVSKGVADRCGGALKGLSQRIGGLGGLPGFLLESVNVAGGLLDAGPHRLQFRDVFRIGEQGAGFRSLFQRLGQALGRGHQVFGGLFPLAEHVGEQLQSGVVAQGLFVGGQRGLFLVLQADREGLGGQGGDLLLDRQLAGRAGVLGQLGQPLHQFPILAGQRLGGFLDALDGLEVGQLVEAVDEFLPGVGGRVNAGIDQAVQLGLVGAEHLLVAFLCAERIAQRADRDGEHFGLLDHLLILDRLAGGQRFLDQRQIGLLLDQQGDGLFGGQRRQRLVLQGFGGELGEPGRFAFLSGQRFLFLFRGVGGRGIGGGRGGIRGARARPFGGGLGGAAGGLGLFEGRIAGLGAAVEFQYGALGGAFRGFCLRFRRVEDRLLLGFVAGFPLLEGGLNLAPGLLGVDGPVHGRGADPAELLDDADQRIAGPRELGDGGGHIADLLGEGDDHFGGDVRHRGFHVGEDRGQRAFHRLPSGLEPELEHLPGGLGVDHPLINGGGGQDGKAGHNLREIGKDGAEVLEQVAGAVLDPFPERLPVRAHVAEKLIVGQGAAQIGPGAFEVGHFGGERIGQPARADEGGGVLQGLFQGGQDRRGHFVEAAVFQHRQEIRRAEGFQQERPLVLDPLPGRAQRGAEVFRAFARRLQGGDHPLGKLGAADPAFLQILLELGDAHAAGVGKALHQSRQGVNRLAEIFGADRARAEGLRQTGHGLTDLFGPGPGHLGGAAKAFQQVAGLLLGDDAGLLLGEELGVAVAGGVQIQRQLLGGVLDIGHFRRCRLLTAGQAGKAGLEVLQGRAGREQGLGR